MLVGGEDLPVSSPLSNPNRKVSNFPITLSLRTQKRRAKGVRSPSHSHQEDKSDQFVLSLVIPPQGTSTPGDVTTSVTDTPVLPQDPSPVSNDTLPSSSAPVKQKGTADNAVTVSVDVHEVPDSEQDEVGVSGDPLAALAHTMLGTQTGRELSHQKDPFQLSSQEEMENEGRNLTLDPAKPLAELVGQIRAYLSPTRGYAPGGERVPPFDRDDLAALEGYVDQVGWTELPLLQPKQVPRTVPGPGVARDGYPSGPVRGHRVRYQQHGDHGLLPTAGSI